MWPARRRAWMSPGRSSRRRATAGGACRVTIAHRFEPRLPGFAGFVDRWFTRPIAGRTLATFKALARTATARAAPPSPAPPLADEPIHMNGRRRVWITGIGIVTRGRDRPDAFRAGLRAGQSPVRTIDRFDPSPFRSHVAAQVDDFDPLAWMPPKTARQLDRFSQFGLVAGRLALEDASFTPGARGAADPERVGIYLGSALGGIAYAEAQHERFLEQGIRQVAPNLALAVFGGAAPANLGIALDVRGPILSTANSCASGAVALGEALGDLRDGRVDAAIAGGCEIPLSPLAFGAFDIIRALSAGHNETPATAARPFDRERDGFVMGEGAALLVLEDAEAAERRGARPYAELLGYGATSDAHHMVQPRADGREAARAASIALDDGATIRRRSTTSTRMRRRRPSATSPRLGRSHRAWASTPRPCRSAAPRRCTGTRSVPRAPSRPRSARWPSPTATPRRR